jgi:hypothetical protein
MPQPAVSIREERSVTDVLNATFLFIRQNIRIYGKMLGFLIMPVFGLGVILATIVTTTVDFSGRTPLSDVGAVSLGTTALLFLLTLLVVSLAIYTGALTIVRLYDERGAGNFDLEDVWQAGKSKLPGFFGIGFLLGLIYTIPLVLVFWIPCLNLIAMFGWLLYVFGTFGLAYAAYIMEDCSVGESLSRSRELVRNYFWPTVGLYVLATIIVTVIGSIAQIPFQVLAFSEGFLSGTQDISGDSAVYIALSYIAALLVSTFLGLIPQVAMTFQYTNLVERKENIGLQRRVEQIAEDADADPFDKTPRTDPARDHADADAEASPADPFAPHASGNGSGGSSGNDLTDDSTDDVTGGSGRDVSTQSAERSRADEDGDDSEWAPPRRDRGEDASGDRRQVEEEPDDGDNRWRPPQS